MENHKNTKINTPTAIIVAGFLIMLAILITRGGSSSVAKEKTLSEQVGVNKDKFAQCMKDTDLQALQKTTSESADKAMSGVPADQRGTPYIVVVGKNGSKAEIRGAYPKEEVQKIIAQVTAGKVTTPYTGQIPAVTAEDHIIGNIDAPIVIVEYSDLECPYCKRFNGVMKEIVAESNGNVAWVYRHWIVHQGALAKAGASECVAKLKGNDAFWKYVDLVFGLIQTEDTTTATSNL
jgi:protein-disulfide isomerase